MTHHRKVLLVDDDREILHGASLRLRAAGYETLTAHDGRQGVASAVKNAPDAILLDVRMPGQDGFAALDELRQLEPTKKIPIVVLSASVADQQRALEAGARFFLPKPYRGETLLAAVHKAVEEALTPEGESK